VRIRDTPTKHHVYVTHCWTIHDTLVCRETPVKNLWSSG